MTVRADADAISERSLTIMTEPGRNGFTLIELLVVVAIISLLISILLPSLRRAKDLAHRTICASNERSLVTALLSYACEFDDWLPRPYGWGSYGAASPYGGYNGSAYYDGRDGREPVDAGLYGLVAHGYSPDRLAFCPSDIIFGNFDIPGGMCSYDYRPEPAPGWTWFLDESPFSVFFNYRLGVYPHRAALLADTFTTSWNNWVCSHNRSVRFNSPDDPASRGPQFGPGPDGFNIGFIDGGVAWLDFEWGQKPWSGAYMEWHPTEFRFFMGLDGCQR